MLKKANSIYLSKPRRYRYKNISVWVEPGVFPPFMTLSTKILLEFIETLDLKNKSFLELGCGCGIISILASQKGAYTTATDINETALSALEKNAKNNNVNIEILHSDLFQNLKGKHFEYIIINPPYYPKNPGSIIEKAWFCGENFEYFEDLFQQLTAFTSINSKIYMILSEDCQIDQISWVAQKNNLHLNCIVKKSVFKEINYIYAIEAL